MDGRISIPRHSFGGDISLVNLGDVHRGDDACDTAALYRVIKQIEQDPDTYWFSTGDLLNVALASSKSSSYSSMNLDEEMEALTREIRPITSKCLGLVSSNHHLRVEREIGMSLDALLAREWRVPFLGDLGEICVVCDRAAYYMVLFHGFGGGVTRGGKANKAERPETVLPGADLYATGHTHSFAHFISSTPILDRKRNIRSSIDTHFVVTGHFLNYGKSYAPRMALKPMPCGSSRIKLHATGCGRGALKRIDVDLIG